jgi:hypothetical protein
MTVMREQDRGRSTAVRPTARCGGDVELCGDDPERSVACRAVEDALAARRRLWDGILERLPVLVG